MLGNEIGRGTRLFLFILAFKKEGLVSLNTTNFTLNFIVEQLVFVNIDRRSKLT